MDHLKIGKFLLYPGKPGTINIEINGDGEGGGFDEKSLEEVIANFYNLNF